MLRLSQRVLVSRCAVASAVRGKTHSLPRAESLCLINLTPTTSSLSPYLPFHSQSRPSFLCRSLLLLSHYPPSLTPFVLLAFLLPSISFLAPTCLHLFVLFSLLSTQSFSSSLDFPSHRYLFFTVTFSFPLVACSSPEQHDVRPSQGGPQVSRVTCTLHRYRLFLRHLRNPGPIT